MVVYLIVAFGPLVQERIMDVWREERGGGEAEENCNVLPLGNARTSADVMLRDH